MTRPTKGHYPGDGDYPDIMVDREVAEADPAYGQTLLNFASSLDALKGEVEPERDRDSVYTPLDCARACISALSRPEGPVLEPSVGGGAFLQAAAEAWPDIERWAVDIDPGVRGFEWAHAGWEEDWCGCWPLSPPGLIIGNPPFSNALVHVIHALHVGPNVAMLLPLAVVGSRGWGTVLGRQPDVLVLVPRPFRQVRETALFLWSPDAQGRVRQLIWK